MKIITFIITLLSVLLIGCSGAVQTNKIPDETKYILPERANSNTFDQISVSTKEQQDFSNTLSEFFKKKSSNYSINNNDEENFDIYRIGIEKGYFK